MRIFSLGPEPIRISEKSGVTKEREYRFMRLLTKDVNNIVQLWISLTIAIVKSQNKQLKYGGGHGYRIVTVFY